MTESTRKNKISLGIVVPGILLFVLTFGSLFGGKNISSASSSVKLSSSASAKRSDPSVYNHFGYISSALIEGDKLVLTGFLPSQQGVDLNLYNSSTDISSLGKKIQQNPSSVAGLSAVELRYSVSGLDNPGHETETPAYNLTYLISDLTAPDWSVMNEINTLNLVHSVTKTGKMGQRAITAWCLSKKGDGGPFCEKAAHP
ncbi:MAG: hypothetical protein QM647_15670 [Asticcacaulis sp.]|uniref:hypothetical protein n=1 Tax=Asticcacaulis sp. TaxID=1872648 RepID=UPI0039E3B1B9